MLRETIGAPSIQFSKLRELTHADSAETAIGLLPVLRISQENMSTEKIVYCGSALSFSEKGLPQLPRELVTPTAAETWFSIYPTRQVVVAGGVEVAA